MDVSLPVRPAHGGVELIVRLTPKSSRDMIEGTGAAADGAIHLKARVRAVPEKGKANDALEKLVAKWLGVASGTVKVTAGHTARLKTLTVSGDTASLERLVRERLEQD